MTPTTSSGGPIAAARPRWSFEVPAPAPAAEPPAATGPAPRRETSVASVAPWSAWARAEARPLRGPLGRRRRPLAVALAAVLTGGLSTVAWVRRVNREIRHFDARSTVRPGRTALAVFPLVAAAWLAAAGGAARLLAERLGHPAPWTLPTTAERTVWLCLAPAAVSWLVLAFSPAAAALALTLERVRGVEDLAGVQPDRQVRPARALAVLLLPGIGLGILAGRAQRRLNAAWVAVRD